MGGNLNELSPSVIASWPKPNYVDPVRRSWLPAFAIVWQSVSTVLVFVRFYLRARRRAGPFGWDDAFIAIAWLISLGFTACAWIDSTQYGIDRHIWDVPINLIPGAALMAWISQLFMTLSTSATKVSVLLFYQRMVVDTLARRWKYAIYGALTFHALCTIGTVLALLLACTPIEAYWRSYDATWHKQYTCVETRFLNPLVGSLAVLSDIYAVVLPFCILAHYKLDIPRRQKIALNCIFATGLLVAGAGVVRTYHLTRFGQVVDTFWEGFSLFVWSIVELQLAIICACAPTLRAFFRRYLADTVRRYRSKGSRSHSHTSPHISAQKSDHAHDQKYKREAIDMHVLTRPSEESIGNKAAGSWITNPDSLTPVQSTVSRNAKPEPMVWQREVRPWPHRENSVNHSHRPQEAYSTL